MKIIIRCLLIYFFIGFIYHMNEEYRMGLKYNMQDDRNFSPREVLIQTLCDPWAYVRSICFSPFWPEGLYWDLSHLPTSLELKVQKYHDTKS